MRRRPTLPRLTAVALGLWAAAACLNAEAAAALNRYFAHEAEADDHGVIAPWYQGLNGQFDERVRVAAETLKKYPWLYGDRVPIPAPAYIYSGHWRISPEGDITLPEFSDWNTGDFGQRAGWTLDALVDYYAYTGDAAAIAHMHYLAEVMLGLFMTNDDHDWPGILISVPVKGPPLAAPDPTAMIQLDIVAQNGLHLLRAYEVTGEKRWLEAAKHWADMMAEQRLGEARYAPWNRYANPEDVWWDDRMTGGVAILLSFFDTLLAMGYEGEGGAILEAREAGMAYLRDELLPQWTAQDAWGRHYWDVPNHWESCIVADYAPEHFMDHPEYYAHWRADVPNVLTLFINRTTVYGAAGADTYHGAWAYPESFGCCRSSLSYAPQELAARYARYAALTGDEWAREMARRQITLTTYDFHQNGVIEDNIHGGPIVTGGWSKIAVQMAMDHVLECIEWMPGLLGANRENHLVRSSATVRDVVYGAGDIHYETAPGAGRQVDALRLAFTPTSVTADGESLGRREELNDNGFTTEPLSNGDCVVTIRRDGATRIRIQGDDPAQTAHGADFAYDGHWDELESSGAHGGSLHAASAKGAAATLSFTGNQIRLLGRYGPGGGLADVYLDGEKQAAPMDCYLPERREQQALFYRSGLGPGEHELKVVARGEGNPYSSGTAVYIDAAVFSDARGKAGRGVGGGPVGAQRMVFGRPDRLGYTDVDGNWWKPGLEFVAHTGNQTDIVEKTWTTEPQRIVIGGANEPELYRYGIHAKRFTVNLTVGPGVYSARLMFAETRSFTLPPEQRAFSISLNGERMVENFDIASTAAGVDEPLQVARSPYTVWAGRNKAVDLRFNGITPEHGVISFDFEGMLGEATLQALELTPGAHEDEGATPVSLPPIEVARDEGPLANPGFEQGVPDARLSGGGHMQRYGWRFAAPSTGESYFYPESTYSEYPDFGEPKFRGGDEALRTHSEEGGRTLAFQEAKVEPATTYEASVWVKTADLGGRGFGASPGDAAALRIQELGPGEVVVTEHASKAITGAGPYRKLSVSFTTGPSTNRIRYVLDTRIGCAFTEGHVTYDDCALTPHPSTEQPRG